MGELLVTTRPPQLGGWVALVTLADGFTISYMANNERAAVYGLARLLNADLALGKAE
jgi:hypothetical protein